MFVAHWPNVAQIDLIIIVDIIVVVVVAVVGDELQSLYNLL